MLPCETFRRPWSTQRRSHQPADSSHQTAAMSCVCTNLVCAKGLTNNDLQQRYTHALVYSKAGNLGAWTSNRQQRIRIVLGLRVPKEPRRRQLPSALDGGWLAIRISNIEFWICLSLASFSWSSTLKRWITCVFRNSKFQSPTCIWNTRGDQDSCISPTPSAHQRFASRYRSGCGTPRQQSHTT